MHGPCHGPDVRADGPRDHRGEIALGADRCGNAAEPDLEPVSDRTIPLVLPPRKPATGPIRVMVKSVGPYVPAWYWTQR